MSDPTFEEHTVRVEWGRYTIFLKVIYREKSTAISTKITLEHSTIYTSDETWGQNVPTSRAVFTATMRLEALIYDRKLGKSPT